MIDLNKEAEYYAHNYFEMHNNHYLFIEAGKLQKVEKLKAKLVLSRFWNCVKKIGLFI